MNFYLLKLFLYSAAGTIGLTLPSLLFIKLYKQSTPSYVGAIPLMGALIGACAFFTDTYLPNAIISTGAVLSISIIGFISDYYKKSDYKSLSFSLGIVIAATVILSGFAVPQAIYAIIVCLIFVFSFKVSAIFFETPQILCLISSLSILALSQHIPFTFEQYIAAIALASSSALLLLAALVKAPFTTGTSGYALMGCLMGLASFSGYFSESLVLASLLPVMVFVFFPGLVVFIVLFSYFGNRLHDSTETRSRFSWHLDRIMLNLITLIIFASANMLFLLQHYDRVSHSVIALLMLVAVAMVFFMLSFARKAKSNPDNESDEVHILATRINAVTPQQVLDKIEAYLSSESFSRFFHVVTADSLALVRAQSDSKFKACLQSAALVIPDGAGIIWASDFLGHRLPSRVPGVALVSQICEQAAKTNRKVFFIGSKTEIVEKAKNELLSQFPDLQVAGAQHGYFKADSSEEAAAINAIKKSRPHIVFVAMGVPRQEQFIKKLEQLGQIVAIGVGGSFDVISGALPRAPIWMQRCGIEWLFRLWLEPKRIWRMLDIPVFITAIIKEKIQ